MPGIRRYKHSLSHYKLTTFDMGLLVPCGLMEVLPGDTLAHAVSVLLRVTPLVKPVMHPVHVRVHNWFVPSRLLWDDWEDFITQRNPAAVLPTITLTGSNENLVDQLGVPAVSGLEINALPIRAYNLIFNEFYRDQDLTTAVGTDQTLLQRAAWEKDYFTTARVQPQQGSEAIVNFSTGDAPIQGLYASVGASSSQRLIVDGENVPGGTVTAPFSELYARRTGTGANDDLQEPIVADMSQASGGFSVSDFWAAEAAQRWAMRRNRFGSRYVDLLAAMGVNAGDARLQRPEYLGGGKQTISFSEVLSTADTTAGGGLDLGDYAGHGIAALRTRRYKYFAREHGYMVSLVTVRPKTVYVNAIDRTWLRRSYDDYWQKEFEILPEQALTETEIYANGGNTSNVFGYQQAHQDYRHIGSKVSGLFRTTENDWHYGRTFSSAPTLNGSFVECTPTDRVYAATSVPECYSMIHHSLMARRLVRKTARNP